jgi:hypothetical protein
MATVVSILAGIALLITLIFVGKFAIAVIQPKLVEFFDTSFLPTYVPSVVVSASIDGGITYTEKNLKQIPQGKVFFLKFYVRIKRRGIYWGDETFNVTVKNNCPGAFTMRAIEYSGEKETPADTFSINVSKRTGRNTIIFRCKSPSSDDSKGTERQTNEKSDAAQSESLPTDSSKDTVCQIHIKSHNTRLKPLDETIEKSDAAQPESLPTGSSKDTVCQIHIKSHNTRLNSLDETIALVFTSDPPKTEEKATTKISLKGELEVQRRFLGQAAE